MKLHETNIQRSFYVQAVYLSALFYSHEHDSKARGDALFLQLRWYLFGHILNAR